MIMFPYATALFALTVSEQSFRPVAHPVFLVCLACGLALTLRATAAAVDPELERLALRALLDALDDAHLCAKEVCALLNVSKGQWSEICSGQRHTPSHTRLLNLPWAFWQVYLPSLAWLLAKHKIEDLTRSTGRVA